MDFVFTEEQGSLSDSIRRFCREQYGFDVYRRRMADPADRKFWSQFADLGWFGAGLSEDEGGYGGGPVEASIVAEEFGRGLVVEPYLSSAVLSIRTLLALDSDTCRALVADIVGGQRVIALAHSEPEAWGDPAHIETTATRDADGAYRLSGHKSLVLDGSIADSLLVVARTGGGPGDIDGVSLFVVGGDEPGLRRQDYRLVDRRPASDIWLDDVRVAGAALLGNIGKALPAIETGLDHACMALCADSVGAMDVALWMTRDYLTTRRQFGQPIGNFQALQHRMADMLVQTELARSMVYQGLNALGRGPSRRAAGVSAAKVAVADAGLFVGQQAIQLHGGIGMTEEYAVGHYYKRLFVNASLFGNRDFHGARFSAINDQPRLEP
jgi:alkylation response protein AidB-like acyl-CoA dehydrogenase